MDEDRVGRLLEEIRDLQRRQLEAQAQVLLNQQEAIRVQRAAAGRARKLLAAIGIVIAIVLIIVLLLLRYILKYYR
jgi:CHASE3 domain sensor protein